MKNKKVLKPKTLKGFRDILPEELVVRQKVIEILVKTFESFGFLPLETPVLEYASTLLGKCGKEAEKLVYTFKDRGGREVGLKYDLTIPVSKVLSIYRDKITLPFKRYQIQSVFRAEKPQKGRYRDPTQCDIDIFGIKSPLADAEIILVIYTALKNLGFKEFVININSRKTLFSLLEKAGIKNKKLQLSVLQSIDKLDKKPKEKVREELLGKGVNKDKVNLIFKALSEAKADKELKQIFTFLKGNGVPDKFYSFSPSMVRGLSYYTRAIYETYVTKPKIGSITGGGRYDNLIELLGGPDISGTGTSIGLDRIVDVITELNLWPEVKPSKTKVLVSVFEDNLFSQSAKLASSLRNKGINTELYLNPQVKLNKQLKYADKKGVPWVIILGPEEIKEKKIVLKNMETRKQEKLTLTKVITKLRKDQL